MIGPGSDKNTLKMGGTEEELFKKLNIFFPADQTKARCNLYKGKKEASCQPGPQLQVTRNHTLMKY